MRDDIDLLLKLFDILKDSSDKNEEATQQLILQQIEMLNYMKNMPIADLRRALKEHSEKSGEDIDTCTETVETTTGDIMSAINNIARKIDRMLWAVGIIVSLLAPGYFIIRYLAEITTK